MDEFTGFGGFDRAAEVLGATEKIAAGDPPGRLPFAEHDRVEVLAVRGLHGQRSAALLIQSSQGHPDFERFLPQIGRERFGDDPRVRAVQDQTAATDDSAAFGPPVHGPDGIAQILLETPSGQRRRQMI